jgi:hypothetical protein
MGLYYVVLLLVLFLQCQFVNSVLPSQITSSDSI